jgi:hypothetical protein
MLKYILCITTLFFVISPAFADISISPLKHEMTIEQWSSDVKTIKIKNDGDTAVTLYWAKEDFIAGDDSGFPRFIKPEDLPNPELSLTNWIDLENENITLAAWESRQVRFTVNVPENSEPGGHYWVIFFGPEAEQWAQLSVIQRLWVLLLIDVPGEVKIAWEFRELTTWNKQADTFLVKESFDNFPIEFSTMFNNSWNTHLKPKGQIELVDENWDILKKVWKEKIISPSGALIWEKVVDYIPVNEGGWNVLPDSDRRFISTWGWFGYTVLNETTGQKEVEFKNLTEYYIDKTSEEQKFIKFYQTVKSRTVTKPITANYILFFEGKDNKKQELRTSNTFFVTYEEKYIWINNILIGILVIMFIWGGYYFIVIRPKKSSAKEEEIRKKIMEEMKNNK